MLLSAEVVRDIPIVRPSLRYIGATLYVLAVHVLSAAATPNVGAQRGPSDSTTDSSDIPSTPAPDLMPENTANYPSRNRRGNVGAVAAILYDLLALNPATLLGLTDDRSH